MTAVGAPLERTKTMTFEARVGEALVRVVGCGVCHTDLGYYFDGVAPKHALPLALGHEISGEVLSAPGREDLVGKAVIIPAVTPCGECEACQRGRGPICPNQVMPGNDIHGGFASHIVVPSSGLCVVDEPGALENQCLRDSECTLAELSVLADAVTTPYQAIERSGLAAGDLAIVIGLGGVGGFCAQIAAAQGATVVGIDINEERLALMEKYGVSKTFHSKSEDARAIKKELRSWAAERGLPRTGWKIFECSGAGAGQDLAWNLLVHDAFLSIVGFTMAKTSVRLSNLMAFDATAQGNWGCVPEYYPGALELVLSGAVKLKPFVEAHKLDDIAKVFDAAHNHKLVARAVLVP
jgi:6-hydroxycyclohex-1-ene-1-carbonyl-CoA dehydrogenase